MNKFLIIILLYLLNNSCNDSLKEHIVNVGCTNNFKDEKELSPSDLLGLWTYSYSFCKDSCFIITSFDKSAFPNCFDYSLVSDSLELIDDSSLLNRRHNNFLKNIKSSLCIENENYTTYPVANEFITEEEKNYLVTHWCKKEDYTPKKIEYYLVNIINDTLIIRDNLLYFPKTCKEQSQHVFIRR